MEAAVLGLGPPLVLVGGGLTGWVSWEPHARRLSAEHTTVRLQLLSVERGLEDRPLPRGYGVATEAAALGAALDALGLRGPLDLVAWSFGALVTLAFALDHPERARTLTLVEPPAFWVLPDHGRDDPAVRALERSFAAMRGEIGEEQLEAFAAAVGLVPPGRSARDLPQWPTWLQHRRSLRNSPAVFEHRDDPRRLQALDVPALLVTGTGTAPYLRRVHDRLAALLPRARSVEMPAGHAPHLVSMDLFLAELERFLGAERAGAHLPA